MQRTAGEQGADKYLQPTEDKYSTYFLPDWPVDVAKRAKNTRLRTNMTAPTSARFSSAFYVGTSSIELASAVASWLNQDKLLQPGSQVACSDVLLSASISLVKPSFELHLFHLKATVGYSGSGNCACKKSKLLCRHLKSHCGKAFL